MARYDKYEPHAGGFRAPLDVAMPAAESWTPVGVGLNAAGRVVIGAGQTGVIGVLVGHGKKAAGDIVDVMTSGEIVEFEGVAGTAYAAGADGDVASGATGVSVGHTVEATRLIVRVKGAAA